MLDYMNLKVRHAESTDFGGCSYIAQVNHAALAIAAGKCRVALITLAGRPRSMGMGGWHDGAPGRPSQPDFQFEFPYGQSAVNLYSVAAMRHMAEFGTTSEQLAWIKVAASHHAQHNPNAMLRDVVTVEDVVNSAMIADPLHKLDCCVVSDGGGALIVVHPDVAKSLRRPLVKVHWAQAKP